MRKYSELVPFSDIKNVKLRSNTSTMVGERIYYIVKKFPDGKVCGLFSAYDYPSGILVYWEASKTNLVKWLNENEDKINKQFKEIDYDK